MVEDEVEEEVAVAERRAIGTSTERREIYKLQIQTPPAVAERDPHIPGDGTSNWVVLLSDQDQTKAKVMVVQGPTRHRVSTESVLKSSRLRTF